MKNSLFPEIKVNGMVIPAIDIQSEAQNHSAPKGKPGLAWRKAARALIIRELMIKEADRQNIEAKPLEIKSGLCETEVDAKIRALLDLEIQTIPANDVELYKIWKKAPEKYQTEPLWQVSHILFEISDATKPAYDKAKALAEHVFVQLKEDPSLFAHLAKTHSDCPSSANGGALDQLRPGDSVPEFETVVKRLEVGEISKVIKTRFGLHIIKLEAIEPPRNLPFDIAKQRIYEAIEKRHWVQSANGLVESLVANAEIEGIDLKKISA